MDFILETFNNKERPIVMIDQNFQRDIPKHWHAEIEIDYAIGYETEEYYIDNKRCPISSGDILFINSFQVHGGTVDKSKVGENTGFTLVIPQDFINKYCPFVYHYDIKISKINENTYDDERKELYHLLKNCFETLIKLYHQEITEINNFQIVINVLQIFGVFFTHFSTSKEKSSMSTNEDRIYEIINFLHQHYDTRFRLDDLASHFYLSKNYLSRYFKKSMGMTVLEYIESIRVNHAVEKIQTTDMTIEQIATSCGFHSSKALNKSLKKIHGVTAKKFRN